MATLIHPTTTWPHGRTALLQGIWAGEESATQTLLRLTLALVLLPHGAQHLLGAFGGYGFSATVAWMSGPLGFPAPLAAAGILLEFFGPLLLLAGLASRPVALALAVFMAVAGSTHAANGFFMNWFGTLPAGTEGFEYHILIVTVAIVVAVKGGGAYALDRVIARRLRDE